jgi:hypothetical protein
MTVPKYHIFSGVRDKSGLWLDSIEGLEAAKERIRQLSEKSPGHYYVFCAKTLQPITFVDTSSTKQDQAEKSTQRAVQDLYPSGRRLDSLTTHSS